MKILKEELTTGKDIFPTMITPYRADGSVDYETAERYVDWYFENGMTGIFAVC